MPIMRPWLLASLVALAWQPASAQDKPPIVARAEACLRNNVDRVVADDPDLQSAASFLVTFVCAKEVADAARYQKNLAMAAMDASIFKNVPGVTAPSAPASARHGTPRPASTPPLTEASDFAPTVDPETGDFVAPKRSTGKQTDVAFQINASGLDRLGLETVPLDLRQLAGALVLAAREQQQATRH
jgi:hypothetical protein